MKYLDEYKRWTPEYYKHIYDRLLEEIAEGTDLSISKWKKDLLLMLLEESTKKPEPRKILRKQVTKELDDVLSKVYALDQKER